ncbi:YoaK family protein [Novosphingobium sp.]|uniref:YoaK family protein n=1 Tax=Novosphingobium sp. TaxID=1874826 RepID=UPI00286D7E85|nr:YoaK family protein [Novosphingobium sp.]
MNRFDRPRQLLAIGLAALAGFVDAFGFLSADGFFVSFMSGNTTRLAVNLAGDPRSALLPALLIVGFVGGVAIGAIVAERAGTRRKVATLQLVALLLAVSALARMMGWHGAMIAALVLAMGALNNTFRRDGEVAVGLTYMTGALVKLGQAIAAFAMGKDVRGGTSYFWLWTGLAAGAVCGALAFFHLPTAAAWIATAWAGAMALAAAKLPRNS